MMLLKSVAKSADEKLNVPGKSYTYIQSQQEDLLCYCCVPFASEPVISKVLTSCLGALRCRGGN